MQQISPTRFQIEEKVKLPIIFNLSESLMPAEDALEQLRGLANTDSVFHHVAVLSDVHTKKGRKCPTGVAVAANKILPQIMDTAPNCGMRMFSTSLSASDLSKEDIDRVFKELVKEVPTETFFGAPIDFQTVYDICRLGSKGLVQRMGKKYDFLSNEAENTFEGGNEFREDEIPSEREIESVIPKVFLKMAQYRLGVLGMAGNHFLDLMKVDEIRDEKKAAAMGLKKDQLVFFMHTGSGILGQYASYFYTPKTEEHFLTKVLVNLGRMTIRKDFLTSQDIKQIQRDSLEFRKKPEFYQIDPESKLGKAYYLAHRAAGNFGYANRAILSAKIKRTVEKELAEKIDWNLIYDMGHIGVRRENHFGEEVWVHRNGVSRANGPIKMRNHPIFSQTGEPCFFAGSMTTPSYLAVGTNENDITFFSASHGAGKTKNVPGEINKKQLMEKVSSQGVGLYNAKSSGVVKQYSDFYKDINEAMAGIEANKIATAVAKLSPLAVLMA